MIDPIRKGQVGFPMPTARAISRRIRGIHGNKLPAGPYCLAGDQLRKLAPRHVVDALGKAMMLHPVRNRQIFEGDEIPGMDDLPALLMREIVTTPGDPLLRPRDHLADGLARSLVLPRCA